MSTNNKKSLKKNVSWVAFSNIIYAMCQWATLIIIARLGNVTEVGIYSFALAISAPVMLFFSLNLRVAIATDQNNEYAFQVYKKLRYALTFIAMIIIIFIAFLTQDTFSASIIIVLITLGKASESIIDIYNGLFQKHEKHELNAQIVLAKGLSLITSFLLGYLLFHSFIHALILVFIFWTIILLFIIQKAPSIQTEEKPPSSGHIRYLHLLWVTLPLSFAALFDSLTVNSARYIIEYNLGLKELGYFSSVAYFMIAGGTVIGAIGQVITPKLSVYFTQKNQKSYIILGLQSIMIGVMIGLISIAITIFMGDHILSIFYGEEYAQFKGLFTIIMIAATLWYAAGLAGCLINAARMFKYQVFTNLFSFLATFISGIILIKQGLTGVAWAITIGMAIRLLLNSIIFMKIVHSLGQNHEHY